MELQIGEFCPLIKKDCIQLKCKFFCKIAGYNKNTGKDVEEWNCALAFLPMLLIENAGVSRETGAAVESFRNEMVKDNQQRRTVIEQMMLPFERNETNAYGIPSDHVVDHRSIGNGPSDK